MIKDYFQRLVKAIQCGWPTFWFQPSSGETLCCIRIATGSMLAYMHAIWLFAVDDFFGPNAMIDRQTNAMLHESDFTWTYLRYFDSITWLSVHQLFAIMISLMLAAGLFLRVTAPLAWFVTLMVCHRVTGHLFGLDQVVMMLVFGLSIAYVFQPWSSPEPSSQSRSWLRSNFQLFSSRQTQRLSSFNTFATRLMQLQLCAMYLFGGLGKLRGSMWWDGSAIWFSAASYEYQSIDFTWIGQWPLLGSMIAHATIIWETFYCVAVWPKWSRPLTLAMAFVVHLSIAIFLGMITFGTMMIVANLVFVTPNFLRRLLGRETGFHQQLAQTATA